MQRARLRAEALDRRHAAALEHRQQQNARIHGALTHDAVDPLPDDDGAGAAVALRAAFLGALEAKRPAEIFEEGRGGRNTRGHVPGTIENERHVIAHRLHVPEAPDVRARMALLTMSSIDRKTTSMNSSTHTLRRLFGPS